MSRQVKSVYQTPRYVEAWEELPLFKNWLSKGPAISCTNQRSSLTTSKAYCRLCDETLEPTFKILSEHTDTPKHILIQKARRAHQARNGEQNEDEESIELRMEEYIKLRKDYSLISSQVTDSVTGQPAVGLDIRLYKQNGDTDDDWVLMSRGDTDSDGYLDSLIFHTSQLPQGLYKLEYMLSDYYFDNRRVKTTYPMVQPTFEVKDGMLQYHFRVTIAPHFHQVYLETDAVKQEELTEEHEDNDESVVIINKIELSPERVLGM